MSGHIKLDTSCFPNTKGRNRRGVTIPTPPPSPRRDEKTEDVEVTNRAEWSRLESLIPVIHPPVRT